MADEQQAAPAAKPVIGTTTKGVLVGGAAGAGGSPLITAAAIWAQQKYGIDPMVTASILGTAFAFVSAWAAKLMPDAPQA